MNRQLKLVSGFLAAVVGLSALTGCGAALPGAGTTATDAASVHTIVVSGNGTAYGQPDIATIQIGVQTRNTDAGVSVSENTDKMNAITAALKAMGIADKDIQTTNYSVYGQQDYDPQTGQPTGITTYFVDNTVSITVRDLTTLGAVLGQATDAGANSVYGISFGVSDSAALEAEARAKAMADAKARAEQLASAAGVTLGAPMTISEYAYSNPIPYAVERVAYDVAASGAAVPVSSGQLQVTLQVNVTYVIQ
jgi:uncharacterized protein YggE